MIDIHTHVLPGVDDGPEGADVSEQMLRMAAEDGTTAIVATPHADLKYSFDPERCRELIEDLRKRESSPQLYGGCELHLTPENIEKVTCDPKRFTLNGGDCVLLELPNAVLPEMVEPVLSVLFGSGLRVIIAHPERNPSIQRRIQFAEELVQAGCYLQLTAQSIQGGFGTAAESASAHILSRRLAHFVASDAHSATARRPLLSASYSKVSSRYGEAAARTLFRDNPSAALSGAPIRRVPAPGNWFSSLLPWRSNHVGQETSSAELP